VRPDLPGGLDLFDPGAWCGFALTLGAVEVLDGVVVVIAVVLVDVDVEVPCDEGADEVVTAERGGFVGQSFLLCPAAPQPVHRPSKYHFFLCAACDEEGGRWLLGRGGGPDGGAAVTGGAMTDVVEPDVVLIPPDALTACCEVVVVGEEEEGAVVVAGREPLAPFLVTVFQVLPFPVILSLSGATFPLDTKRRSCDERESRNLRGWIRTSLRTYLARTALGWGRCRDDLGTLPDRRLVVVGRIHEE